MRSPDPPPRPPAHRSRPSAQPPRPPPTPPLAALGRVLPGARGRSPRGASRPPSVDLAAQLFRTELFWPPTASSPGTYWYGGHYSARLQRPLPAAGAPRARTVVGGARGRGRDRPLRPAGQRRYGSGARLATLSFGAGTITMLLERPAHLRPRRRDRPGGAGRAGSGPASCWRCRWPSPPRARARSRASSWC